ncbi:MAG: DUF1285 domain-containing protein [Pseudomonadota bacterium]
MQSLIKAAETAEHGGALPPVHLWEPEYCGEMDMVIRRDGSWWHEGVRITRQPLIRLFSRILRKDDDGRTYLVTPVEKIAIEVEAAPFIAVRMDASGEGRDQRIAFATNFDDMVIAGPDHPIRVVFDRQTGEPAPYVHIRGRMEALMTRPVFYELADFVVEGSDEAGEPVLGVWSDGAFFTLGPRP